jgi:hypothetical protein
MTTEEFYIIMEMVYYHGAFNRVGNKSYTTSEEAEEVIKTKLPVGMYTVVKVYHKHR